MPPRPSAQLRTITPLEFAKRLRQAANDHDKRFAFFLGAGCSISSGIPSAGQLVRNDDADTDWLRQLYALRNAKSEVSDDIDDWARKELTHWNPDIPAASYGELIEKLFMHDGDRQREIERICDSDIVFPGFGYAVLSGLMCWSNDPQRNTKKLPSLKRSISASNQLGQFNVVLTTNFDDLLVDAFFYFRNRRPLVINHDSLAPFIRPTRTRPMIIKLHGDHQLSPRNRQVETAALQETMRDRVSVVLHDRCLVFIGYGGADESVLTTLEELPEESLPFGVYWVSKSEPNGILRRWLEEREAVHVKHQDFDELMLLIKQEFNIDDPNKDRYEYVHERYKDMQRILAVQVNQNDADNSRQVFRDALDWVRVDDLIESNPEEAEQLFERLIKGSPNNAEGLIKYAEFLANVRHDVKKAEEYFRRAVEIDPSNDQVICKFADFLSDVKKDADKAEEMYLQAIEKNPNNADSRNNYADFLIKYRKNYSGADEQFDLALNSSPDDRFILTNYAVFLQQELEDDRRAEEIFLRAINAKPVEGDDADPYGSYANFLLLRRQNVEQAKAMYERAIHQDPFNAINLTNYAQALFILNDPNTPRAIRYAMSANGCADNNLHLELVFLQMLQFPKHSQKEKLYEIKKALLMGIRSSGWSLNLVVETAISNGFTPKTWLRKLGKVITEDATIDVLKNWEVWKALDVKTSSR